MAQAIAEGVDPTEFGGRTNKWEGITFYGLDVVIQGGKMRRPTARERWAVMREIAEQEAAEGRRQLQGEQYCDHCKKAGEGMRLCDECLEMTKEVTHVRSIMVGLMAFFMCCAMCAATGLLNAGHISRFLLAWAKAGAP